MESDNRNRRYTDYKGGASDRRTDIVNEHETRIAILEAAQKDHVSARQEHSRAIDELNNAIHETAGAVREGLGIFNIKFDSLLSHIRLGFFLISTFSIVAVFLIGAFFTYGKQLDEKYEKSHAEHAAIEQVINK